MTKPMEAGPCECGEPFGEPCYADVEEEDLISFEYVPKYHWLTVRKLSSASECTETLSVTPKCKEETERFIGDNPKYDPDYWRP